MMNDERRVEFDRHRGTLAGLAAWAILAVLWSNAARAEDGPRLSISWDENWLTIRAPELPGEVRVHYLEAFCRPGSTDADWRTQTVIPHTTTRLESQDGRITLVSELADGVRVFHKITAGGGEVAFELLAENPTDKESQAHWAQPCIRVDKFTGLDQDTYIPKCFIFLDGKLARLPTMPWATEARYVPGQVYCPQHVDRNDVNPRPLSSLVPSNGLMGCYSADDKLILATAWEPYQELFQGVGVCVHSDFRIGGLEPGEKKVIRGKIYIVPADVAKLVERYERDFPEQAE